MACQGETNLFERKLAILYLGAFISSFGVFLVTPYLARHLSENGRVAPATVGLLLGMSYACLRAGGLLASSVSRYIGPVRTMLLGNALRVLGYLMLIGGTIELSLIGLIAIGLGSGFYFPISKALLLRYTSEDRQLKVASIRNVFANVGVALGPLVGLWLLNFGSIIIFVVAACLFAVIGTLTSVLPNPPEGEEPKHGLQSGDVSRLGLLLRSMGEPRVVLTLLMSSGLGFALIQMESSIPLVSTRLNLGSLLILMFVLNALVVVIFQYFAVRIIEHFRRRTVSIVAFLALGSGLVGFGTPTHQEAIWVGAIVLLSVGEVLLSLLIDDVVRTLHPSRMIAIYGLAGVFDAVGGLGGSVLGTSMLAVFGNSASPQEGTYLLLCGVVGLIGVAAVVLHRTVDLSEEASSHAHLAQPVTIHGRPDIVP